MRTLGGCTMLWRPASSAGKMRHFDRFKNLLPSMGEGWGEDVLMAIQTARLTYDQYIAAPEIKARYDILDGEMIMAPAPTFKHQVVSQRIFVPVYTFVTQQRLGVVLYAPLDVIIRTEPLHTRQPDLLYVSNENRHIIGDVVHGGPDLVIEILSPSNSRKDIEGKLADYASVDVKECWLVSPEAGTIELLTLDYGEWKRVTLYGFGDNLESGVLPGLELPVSDIFAIA